MQLLSSAPQELSVGVVQDQTGRGGWNQGLCGSLQRPSPVPTGSSEALPPKGSLATPNNVCSSLVVLTSARWLHPCLLLLFNQQLQL